MSLAVDPPRRIISPVSRSSREYATRYMRARTRAVQQLIDAHRPEYADTLARERDADRSDDPYHRKYYRNRVRATQVLIDRYRGEFEELFAKQRATVDTEATTVPADGMRLRVAPGRNHGVIHAAQPDDAGVVTACGRVLHAPVELSASSGVTCKQCRKVKPEA